MKESKLIQMSKQLEALKKVTQQLIKEIQNNKVGEGFANYQSAFPRKSMTFDNEQFNEILLYVFTGIFILILIDYIYKLGKKSF